MEEVSQHSLRIHQDYRSLSDEENSISSEIRNEVYGDTITLRQERILRIAQININGIPESKDEEKNVQLRQAINDYDLQIVGLSETNRCWHLLEEDNQWRNRTKGWWETSHSSIAYNVQDGELSTSFQPGGTTVLSINEAAHRVMEIGRDDLGLGRWSWTKFRGKHNVTVKVICAYRPCLINAPGENTVHCQHQRVLNLTHDSRSPRQALLEDLGTFILQS